MRKMLILGGGLLAVAVVVGVLTQILPLNADQTTRPTGTPGGTPAPAATPPAELNISPTDHVMGSADAPVTIVEYASLTCPHCAAFHVAVLPELKKKYVDAGKVRFVYRDFPLDNVALQAAQIAECAGKERYFAIIDLVFQTQQQWGMAKDPVAEMAKSLRIAGIGEAEIRTCLANDKLADEIVAERSVAEKKLGVNSTPTLFINGQRFAGPRTIEALDEALGKLLK